MTIRLFLRRILDFDALPILRSVSNPSLWIYGAKDETVPAAESAALLATLKSEKRDITVRTFPDATHSIWTLPMEQPFRRLGFARGYMDTVKDWVSQRLTASR